MQLALAAMMHRTKARAFLRPHKRPPAMPLSPSPTPSRAKSRLFFEMPTKRYFSIAMDWRKLVLTKMTHWLLLGKTHGWWLSFVLYPTYLTNIIMKAWNGTVNCCDCSWNLWFVVIASRCARHEYGMLAKIAYEYFSMSELRVTSFRLSLKEVDMSKMLAYASRRVYK